MKKYVLLLFLFVACETTTTEPIRVGGAFGLTGWADAWGEEDLRGATMAIEEVNSQGGIRGRSIELIVQDTKGTNEGTYSAVQALIAQDVIGVIGPTWLETYGSAAALSDEGTLLITPSGVIEAIQLSVYHPYVYSTWYSFDEEMQYLLAHFSQEGHTSVAMLLGLTPYWQSVSTIVHREAENYGITVVGEFASDDEMDYRTMLLQLEELEPDVILFGMDDETDMFAFVKQHKELGITAPLAGQEYLLSFATDPRYVQQFEGIQIVSPILRETAFSKLYEEKYGEPAQLSASNSYDATHILLEAYRKTDGSLEKMHHYLNTNTFSTQTYSSTRFGRNGGVRNGEYAVYEMRDGEAVLVS